jgi:hypothetical protein
MTTFSLLLLTCLTVMTVNAQHMLTVMGTVSANSARILLDWIGAPPASVVRVDCVPFDDGKANNNNNKQGSKKPIVRDVELSRSGAPTVVQVTGLEADTLYLVAVMSGLDGVAIGSLTFRSRPRREALATRSSRFGVVSCNRITEDNDLRGWSALGQFEPEPEVVMHLGDQIYADADAKRFILDAADRRHDPVQLYRETVEHYRANYRTTWSHPTVAHVLRRGEHWMIPDDHDFLNNLSPDMWRNATLRPLLRAGLQTFYEYQMRLHSDVAGADAAFARCAATGGRDDAACAEADRVAMQLTRFDVRGSTAVAMIDVRVERMVLADGYQLVSDAHLARVREQFAAWRDDASIKSILLVTSIPLVFLNPMITQLVVDWEREFYTWHSRHLNETLQLLDIAYDAHQVKPVVLVGGDFHMSHESLVCRQNGTCMRQFVSSGITEGSSSLRSNSLFWLYVYLYHVHSYDGGLWSMRLRNMAISPNFLIIDDATRIRAVYDISLDLVETAWIALWRFFPLALAVVVLLATVACAFRCLQRGDKAPKKPKTH